MVGGRDEKEAGEYKHKQHHEGTYAFEKKFRMYVMTLHGNPFDDTEKYLIQVVR